MKSFIIGLLSLVAIVAHAQNPQCPATDYYGRYTCNIPAERAGMYTASNGVIGLAMPDGSIWRQQPDNYYVMVVAPTPNNFNAPTSAQINLPALTIEVVSPPNRCRDSLDTTELLWLSYIPPYLPGLNVTP